VSKLRFEDLSQLPDSILSDVLLTLCFLRLSHTQSDFVKQGLQRKGTIELVKSRCPLADNLDRSLVAEGDGNNLSTEGSTKNQQGQNQFHQLCLVCQRILRESRPQSSTKEENGQ
jgi:hypothetical protein